MGYKYTTTLAPQNSQFYYIQGRNKFGQNGEGILRNS